MSIPDLLFAILLPLILYGVFLPTFVIFIKRIWYVRKTLIMKKRFINASIGFSVFACMWLFITEASRQIVSSMEVNYENDITFRLMKCLWIAVYPFSCQGAVYCLLYRFWMIYFEFIYAESLKNEQWKIQINPSGCSKNERWIITHRKDFGQPQWVKKRLFIVYISVASISTLGYWLSIFNAFDWELWSSVDSILFITPLIAIFTLWYKMPSFCDTFLVKDELKWIIIIYIISFIQRIIITVAFKIDEEEIKNSPWGNLAVSSCVLFSAFFLIFIQTQYILNKIKKNYGYYRDILILHDNIEYSMNSQSAASTFVSVNRVLSYSKEPSNNSQYKLCDILQNVQYFTLFMHHLSTELSTECLFSFIEFTQFRNLIETDDESMIVIKGYAEELQERQDTLSIRMKIKSNSYDKIVLLNQETIPLSYIIYEQVNNDNISTDTKYKRIMKLLSDKYIDESADFCINIDYATRRSIKEWINKYCYDDKQFEIEQLHQAYCLFESCRKEMYKLMKHTFERFLKTDQFVKVSGA